MQGTGYRVGGVASAAGEPDASELAMADNHGLLNRIYLPFLLVGSMSIPNNREKRIVNSLRSQRLGRFGWHDAALNCIRNGIQLANSQ